VKYGPVSSTAEEAQHRIARRIDLLVLLHDDLDRHVDEKTAEQVEDEVEVLEDGGPDADEDATGQHRAHDAPEEDAVLVGARHAEIREDEQEDEEVVGGKGQLEEIALRELKPLGHPEALDDVAVERAGQGDPNHHPQAGFAHAQLARLPVENAEVHRQGSEHHEREEPPDQRRANRVHHGVSRGPAGGNPTGDLSRTPRCAGAGAWKAPDMHAAIVPVRCRR
jgi:hypothetical protein